MTFSIAGRCARTGALGVAITSSSPAVAARCAFVSAGVGAVTTQNVTDPRLGPALLGRLAEGSSAPEAIAAIVAQAPFVDHRQLTAIDAAGGTDTYSGSQTLGVNTSASGVDCVAAGNLLADADVIAAAVAGFEADHSRPLEQRLLDALARGLARGGEAGPLHSAGLLVAEQVEWPVTDLRVDWDDEPIAALQRLWDLWQPQRDAYVTRALDPTKAPGYGVPGDDR
jgi:uncharacterized Ntn-hydrolase superfamily protein